MWKRAMAYGSLLLAAGLAAQAPAAPAKEGGLRLDAGPEVGYSRYSDGSTQGWAASAYLGVDAWSGPFGLVFQARKGTRVSEVAFTGGELTSTMTLSTEVALAPSFNITPGPLHLRVAVGPWFGHSEERTETLSDSDLTNYWADWSGLRFMGPMAEVRLDANLPLLSPFFVLAIHGQHTLAVYDPSYSATPGDYSARDVSVTGGLRLNVVPVVKLSVAAFTGQSQHVLQSDLSGGARTWEVTGQTYGLSVWATLKL